MIWSGHQSPGPSPIASLFSKSQSVKVIKFTFLKKKHEKKWIFAVHLVYYKIYEKKSKENASI